MRIDNRVADQLRPTQIHPQYLLHPEGSVLIESGRTKVICTASVEDRVPPFLRNTGKGWVTAEYGMLPRATSTRTTREASAGKVGGRTQEIQRLIGRSLRSVMKLEQLGERTVWIDCDVIQADGGTRTAAITGAFVALVLALEQMRGKGTLSAIPVVDYVAATSVGIIDNNPDARPRVRRRLARGGGHERGDDRRGKIHRGAGNGGSPAFRPRRAQPTARPCAQRDRPFDRAAETSCRSHSEVTRSAGHDESREIAGDSPHPRRPPFTIQDARRFSGRHRRGRNRCDVRRKRPTEGAALRGAHGHADDGRRFGLRSRRAQRRAGNLLCAVSVAKMRRTPSALPPSMQE